MKLKSCIMEESQIVLNVINNLKSKTASLNIYTALSKMIFGKEMICVM